MLAPAVLVCLGLGLAQGRPSASAQAPQLQTTGFSSFDPNTGTYTVGTNTNLYQVEFSDFDNIWRRCLLCYRVFFLSPYWDTCLPENIFNDRQF